jgi:hypothetical protein
VNRDPRPAGRAPLILALIVAGIMLVANYGARGANQCRADAVAGSVCK